MNKENPDRKVYYGCSVPDRAGWYVYEQQFSNMENRNPEYSVWTLVSENLVAGMHDARVAACRRREEVKTQNFKGYDGNTYPRNIKSIYISS